jgi:lipoprotein-anchoring transpeptidase ErfK/SrfK
VVTGNTRLGRGTPEKVCYVYYKQRHRTLIGPDYRTPVSYWMAVNGNIGIHDASWRGKFGGTIYKTNGSHGCINTPTKAVSVLYDLVEIGTPVIIFY